MNTWNIIVYTEWLHGTTSEVKLIFIWQQLQFIQTVVLFIDLTCNLQPSRKRCRSKAIPGGAGVQTLIHFDWRLNPKWAGGQQAYSANTKTK